MNADVAADGTRMNADGTRINTDFSDVRIHTDKAANESAESINAEAYTFGNDIVFGKDKYQPGTKDGNMLMAHELGHVGQQKESGQKQVQRHKYIGGIPGQERVRAPQFNYTGNALSFTRAGDSFTFDVYNLWQQGTTTAGGVYRPPQSRI